jgi:hypothetical protein
MLQDYNQTLRPAGTSLYPDSYREEDQSVATSFTKKRGLQQLTVLFTSRNDRHPASGSVPIYKEENKPLRH